MSDHEDRRNRVTTNLVYIQSTLTKKHLIHKKCLPHIKRVCSMMGIQYRHCETKARAIALLGKIQNTILLDKWKYIDITPTKAKKKTIPLALREQVWRKTMGKVLNDKCPCCCQNEISPWNFECGHIKAESKGGATVLENLRAICGPCNKSMGTTNMKEYMKVIWKGRRRPNRSKSRKGRILQAPKLPRYRPTPRPIAEPILVPAPVTMPVFAPMPVTRPVLLPAPRSVNLAYSRMVKIITMAILVISIVLMCW